jgi:uncharacterized membrane protein YbhN (UPF0104 family)
MASLRTERSREPISGVGTFSGRTVLVRATIMLVPVAAVVLVVDLLVPGAERRLQTADPTWLVVAVALEAGALVSYAALFHAVFARPPAMVRFHRSAEIALGELAGYALAPGGAGGPAIRVWALRGGGMSWRTIGERSVVHGVIFNVPYVGAALALGSGVAVGVLPGSALTIVALAPLGVVAGTVSLSS